MTLPVLPLAVTIDCKEAIDRINQQLERRGFPALLLAEVKANSVH